ncbi:MAG TPA: ABC transporter ATP-binding protein [Geminicoccus sp.]|jgi:multiple sugar transport system ATP-binding protein|uniref:ABC transporter ATP-binding protein n=1 Tax=Geminicoccus sp. TaxID=2024832 RepID=UPI002E34B6DB|nr:ABC transporter ATP-binding protein [Geminicoccus sp.]HEX2528943.1 ABC transporter ATP-binding protein [Geminicoccus sp.]
MAFLDLDRISVAFKKEQVLKEASLSVERGETVVVFGPSGGGKTVLLRLVSGVMQPDSGDVRLGGRSLLGAGPEQRDVGMAFQNFALYPHMPAFENIASPLRARGMAGDEIARRVQETARLLKIDHVLKHFPKELSNGQKQRTALGRALIAGPEVLLLDDPLRNVDAKLRYEMRIELPRLLKSFGGAVLYVTQDYKEAMALGDRVAVLLDGRFLQVDRPAEIYRKPADIRIARLFGDPTINLVPVKPRLGANGPEVDIFGSRVSLPAQTGHLLDRDCMLALRPEHIEVRTEPVDGGIPMELDAVTPLNVRTVLFLRSQDGREVLATCSEHEQGRFGRGHRAVHAAIDFGRALFFDPASGTLLPAAA